MLKETDVGFLKVWHGSLNLQFVTCLFVHVGLIRDYI